MAKIIVNEIDKTKAGDRAYQNFSVVVPGFCGKTVAEGVFDDNGIFEVSNQAEFVEKIGKLDKQVNAEAKEPECTKIKETDTAYYRVVTVEEYLALKDNLYTLTPVITRTEVGRLYGHNPDEPNSATIYQYKKAKDEDYTEESKDTLKFVYVLDGDEGVDAGVTTNIGNQMAYELLSLGYTVLYKNLNIEPIIVDNVEYTGIEVMKTAKFWECLKDKAVYDFRYITTGGYFDYAAYTQIAKLAHFVKGEDTLDDTRIDLSQMPGRGDCTALMDIIEDENITGAKSSQSALINAIIEQVNTNFAPEQAIDRNSKIFTPQVNYVLPEDSTYKNITFPASFHYLACTAKSLNSYNEWYAIAGYQRGISDLIIKSTTLNLGDIAQNALTPRLLKDEENGLRKAVNVIVNLRGNYYIWGNRTAHPIEKDGLIASDYANIRELCNTIKKAVYVACRQLTFNPNSDLLWVDFCHKVRPLLDLMVSDQGIRDYAFVKIPTTIKGTCLGKIRIVPIEAVEDFELDLFLEDSLTGVTTSITEE